MENILSEKEILQVIERVLKENRKVIKLPNQTPQPSPLPSPMEQGVPTDMESNENGMPMDNAQDNGMDAMGDNSMDMTNNSEGDSEFDTNFDAGVDADEDSDPKHYIQQLTGKLSQSLNSYNSDNGEDAGLSKYVASMIIAATCKNLDDKAKKELIEKIKSAQSDDLDDTDDNLNDDMPDEDMGNMGSEEGMPDDMEQPINESVYTKKQLMEMISGEYLTNPEEKRPLEQNKINKCPKAWKSKFK